MKPFASLSIKAKLNLIITCASTIILLLASAAFIIKYRADFLSSLDRETESLARVIGINCTSAIVFDDAPAAEQTLLGLRVRPEVAAACIYDRNGRLFARYLHADYTSTPLPPAAQDGTGTFISDAGHLALFHPIVLDRENIGTLYLKINTGEMKQRMKEFMLIAFCIMAGSFVFAILLSSVLQRVISAPILRLTGTMETISRSRNYTIRAEKTTADEIGVLIDGFNEMVSAIETRDTHLENTVASRTRELLKANRELSAEIAERRNEEKERARLIAAIDQLAETVILIAADGAIAYINPAMSSLIGKKASEIIGKNAFYQKDAVKEEGVRENIWKTITEGRVWQGHISHNHQNGITYTFDTTISPVRSAAGHIDSFVAIGRDITTELRLERELFQAQKMEAIGTLAGGIAHDFNNILAAIIGYTELALNSLPSFMTERGNLEQILRSATRARDLIKQILAFSRQSKQEKKPVALDALVKEAIEMLRASLPATVEIKSDLEPECCLLADPVQIHQLLMNLCTNAAHAMEPSGGVLSIGLNKAAVDEKEAAGCYGLTPGTYIQITVADTGTGISPDVIDRIFDPFFTTKEVGAGSGLGLSMAHGIVKTHNGIITVDSTPGSGTCFYIYFPYQPCEVPGEITAAYPLPAGTERILLVDDEQFLTDVGQHILHSLGYRVTPYNDSTQALECFRKNPRHFDIIVTDLTMPRLTGFDLAAQAHAIRPEIPIILCTGYSQSITPDELRRRGISKLVIKPFTLSVIASALRSVLDQSR